jgi:hypothetical protein
MLSSILNQLKSMENLIIEVEIWSDVKFKGTIVKTDG